jgi:predicted DsbA family dithiol-disulfide isomerase
MKALTKVKIDVFSDAVCPWCFVGKRRLEKALAALAKDREFTVEWHPFELNPTLAPEGVSRQEHLARKFGGAEVLKNMDARMKEVGAGEGIAFQQEKILRTPNTFDAHRLIWFAGRAGRQDAVVEALFRAYFTEGRDIGDRAVLAAVAGESGLDASRAAAFLAGEEGRAEVRAAEAKIRAAGIRAVPFFVINGETFVEGAEAPETFIQAIESL